LGNAHQPVELVEHNTLIADVAAICRKVKRAKYGVSLFGSAPFDYGALPDDVASMKATLKALIQKTHPDKANGYDDLFIELKRCLDMINDGIPLPTDKPPTPTTTQQRLT
jgi:hypothetical protein